MIFNGTKFCNIYSCTMEEYLKMKDDEYDEYNLYIVDVSPSPQVYYGRRKLTDVLLVEDIPLSPNYPADKLYLQVKQNKVAGVYYKYTDEDGKLQTAVLGQYFLREFSPQIVEGQNTVKVVSEAYDASEFPVLDLEGQIGQKILDDIIEDFKVDPKNKMLKWGSSWVKPLVCKAQITIKQDDRRIGSFNVNQTNSSTVTVETPSWNSW